MAYIDAVVARYRDLGDERGAARPPGDGGSSRHAGPAMLDRSDRLPHGEPRDLRHGSTTGSTTR